MVIINHNRQTGILIRQSVKYAHVVLMESSGIKEKSIPLAAYDTDWKEHVLADEKEVANRLLCLGQTRFGITVGAAKSLKEIIAS